MGRDAWENTKKVLRHGSAKEIADHFYEYYRLHFFVVILLLVLAGDLFQTVVTQKDYVLQGMLLNANATAEATQNLEDNFLMEAITATEDQEVIFDASVHYSPNEETGDILSPYESLQIIQTRIAAAEIDFMVADFETMNYLAYKGYFSNLNEILSEEEYQEFEPYFLFYDRSFAEELEEINEQSDKIMLITYPDPTRPDLMEDPVPIMVDVSNMDKLIQVYPDLDKGYALGFVVTAPNLGNTIEFLRYLLGSSQ